MHHHIPFQDRVPGIELNQQLKRSRYFLSSSTLPQALPTRDLRGDHLAQRSSNHLQDLPSELRLPSAFLSKALWTHQAGRRLVRQSDRLPLLLPRREFNLLSLSHSGLLSDLFLLITSLSSRRPHPLACTQVSPSTTSEFWRWTSRSSRGIRSMRVVRTDYFY